MKKLKFTEAKEEKNLVKLDLGTGKGATKPEGFIGVDIIKHSGVDKVVDLRKRWPWKSNSVDEINANFLVQYFKPEERIHFVNEAHRVLKQGGKMIVVVPHWCCSRAYGDLAAQLPPVSEAWFQNLNKGFRASQNYIQNGYDCDFDLALGVGIHNQLLTRNVEYQQNATLWWKEAVQDTYCTCIKK